MVQRGIDEEEETNMMKSKAPINPQDYKGAIIFFGLFSVITIAVCVWRIGEVVTQF